MARKPNRIGTETFTISTTPHVFDYLKQLVQTGLYGKTEAEAAERLLTRSLDEILAAGRLKTLKVKPQSRRSRSKAAK